MSTVVLGQNRFHDCRTLIAWRERPVLRAAQGIKSVELDTRELGEGIHPLEIRDGQLREGDDASLVSSEVSVAVLVGDVAILVATLLDPETLHVRLDLRPLGMNVYDDHEGLHVGRNLVAGNTFTGAQVGISLT